MRGNRMTGESCADNCDELIKALNKVEELEEELKAALTTIKILTKALDNQEE